MIGKSFFAGCFFWGILIWAVYCLRTKSKIHAATMETFGQKKRLVTGAVLVMTILICILPMGLSPDWNGEKDDFKNQYEEMAEALFNGHLYIDHEVDPALLNMENPYDYDARRELGVSFEWDHALYNGHYYMYFGVVPVILLFLPFRILTGISLPTLYATQLFAALFICGIFAIFYRLNRKFFPKMTFILYLILSVSFTVMSIWYCIAAPILYCTAIISALCMEVWSLYFFVHAVWFEDDEKKSIIFAFLGSLLGALAFGCRPPAALANLLVLPMLIEYLRNKKFSLRLLLQLILAAMPYIVIGGAIMYYNYLRFDSPFEFGQTYQITIADQSMYGDALSNLTLVQLINGALRNFIYYTPLEKEFPYFSNNNSVFFNFPILLFALYGITRKEVRNELNTKHLKLFFIGLLTVPLIITFFEVVYSPVLIERYRMDLYWLMGLATYIVIGFYYMYLSEQDQRKFSHRMAVWALYTLFTCFWLFIVPYDGNYTHYFAGALHNIEKVIFFGFV